MELKRRRKLLPGAEYNKMLRAVHVILTIYRFITPIVFSRIFASTAGYINKPTPLAAGFLLLIGVQEETTMTDPPHPSLCVGDIVGAKLYRSTQAPYYFTCLEANMARNVRLVEADTR